MSEAENQRRTALTDAFLLLEANVPPGRQLRIVRTDELLPEGTAGAPVDELVSYMMEHPPHGTSELENS